MRILVIDDDPQIRLLMQAILEDTFEVHTFERGEPALELAASPRQNDDSIIAAFIDQNMPGPAGLTIAKELRLIDERIGVILMTGNVDITDADVNKELLDNILLLQKPFAVQEVLLLAGFFKRSWLRDRDLLEQTLAFREENKKRENIALRNEAILETSLDCIITIDSRGFLIEWNPAAELTFGYTKDEIIGKRLSETIIPEVHRAGHVSGMSKYMDTGVGPILGTRLEVPALHKSGREFPVELTVNAIVLDDNTLFTAYLRDLSDKREADAQLQLQSKALEAAANGIVITDPKGHIVWTNSAFHKLSGYSEKELIGNPVSMMKSHLHDDNFYKDLWDTILADKVWMGEIRNRHKNGNIYTEKMTVTPVKNEAGELTHFIAIKEDVTEQLITDEKLDRSEQNQRIINYFATSLLGSNTTEEILWDIAYNCISQVELEDAVVYMVSDDGTELHQKAAYGSNKAQDYEILNPIVIPVGEGIVGHVAASGVAEIIPDVNQDERYIVDDVTRSSEIAVPILYENKVIGVIDSEHSQVDFFKEHHLHILEAIASLASNKLMRASSLELIEKSEKKYRSIFESIQDVYAEVDFESGIITEISPSIERASGYTREEILGSPMADFFNPQGVPPALMEALISEGRVDDFTVNLLTKSKDDRIVSFSVYLTQDAEGNPDKIVGTMRDVTERNVAITRIEESEERLKAILSILPTGVVILEPGSNRIEDANPAAAAILGLPLDELLDKRVHDVMRLNDESILGSEDVHIQDPGDFTMTRVDGDELPLLLTKLPLVIRNKNRVLISFVDNSTQKKAEESLKTNIAMKTNFVSNLSHELRTPMTSIYGFAGTILRDQDMPDDVRLDFTRVIFEESQRLTRLIENVLDLSRMEAGRMTYNMQPLQLDIIIEEALKTQQVTVRDKQIDLVQEVMDDPPLVEADQDSINQLIINLVSNAIKFSDPGGRVTIGLYASKQEIELKISDSGIGIPAEDLPNIFDKFFRVQNEGREDQGTGIGLSIVKEIVDRHKGRINVDSQVGVGTSFTVFLPTL